VGNIVDGSGTGILGAREQIASRTLVPALRAIASDENVKAVVLRVDSGGGSALASEQIWAAMSELGAKKPVVVSMGSVAASGGYYIAASAKTIFAQADTLTGSIGVVGGKVVIRDALANLGVRTYDVHRGARARIWSPVSTWDEAERAAVRELMEQTYATFVDRVAAGRHLEREKVLALAQGRVWTGSDALERGLVDRLGGLDAALAEAAMLGGLEWGGLESGGPLSVYPPEPTLRDILMSLGTVSLGAPLAGIEGSDGLALAAILVPDDRIRGEVLRMLQTIAALQHAHVWALSPSFGFAVAAPVGAPTYGPSAAAVGGAVPFVLPR
jgi:protease-4